MTDKIVHLRDHCDTVDLTGAQVLSRAADADLNGLMVIGVKDGKLHFETSIVDGDQTLWLLEKVKFSIMLTSFGKAVA